MPKFKKPPKNNFTFFMEERKRQLEAQGYRFYGGLKDVATLVHGEWKALPTEEREKYTKMAKEWKEKEKTNLENKFTCSGESYAEMNRRRAAEDEERAQLKALFQKMVHDVAHEDRIYMIMHAQESCQVSVSTSATDKDKMEYYPLELAIAAFSVRDGLICSNWRLVDTVDVPTGYLSDAKTVQEETALPLPGSTEFENIGSFARNYNDILGSFRQFIERWGSDYPDEKYMIFVLDKNMKVVKGCMEWLVKTADENRDSNERLMSLLKFYSISSLFVELSVVACGKDPNYKSEVSQFRNHTLAETKLSVGRYDYKPLITCPYHLQAEKTQKMPACCLNIIQRQIFIMLDEFALPFGVSVTAQHNIQKFKKEIPGRLAHIIQPVDQSSGIPKSRSSNSESTIDNRSESYEDDSGRSRGNRSAADKSSDRHRDQQGKRSDGNSNPREKVNDVRSSDGSEYYHRRDYSRTHRDRDDCKQHRSERNDRESSAGRSHRYRESKKSEWEDGSDANSSARHTRENRPFSTQKSTFVDSNYDGSDGSYSESNGYQEDLNKYPLVEDTKLFFPKSGKKRGDTEEPQNSKHSGGYTKEMSGSPEYYRRPSRTTENPVKSEPLENEWEEKKSDNWSGRKTLEDPVNSGSVKRERMPYDVSPGGSSELVANASKKWKRDVWAGDEFSTTSSVRSELSHRSPPYEASETPKDDSKSWGSVAKEDPAQFDDADFTRPSNAQVPGGSDENSSIVKEEFEPVFTKTSSYLPVVNHQPRGRGRGHRAPSNTKWN